jgi:hypothetical protein
LPPEIAGKMAIPTLLLPPETADLPDRRLVKDWNYLVVGPRAHAREGSKIGRAAISR